MTRKNSRRTFYRNVFVVEVLSEEEMADCSSLGAVDSFITDGPGSGDVLHRVVNQKVRGPRMAKLLEKQGSDPVFFDLTSDGEDADDVVRGLPGDEERVLLDQMDLGLWGEKAQLLMLEEEE